MASPKILWFLVSLFSVSLYPQCLGDSKNIDFTAFLHSLLLGNETGLSDFGKLSIYCRNSQDVLRPSNLKTNEGDAKCIAEVSSCFQNRLQKCFPLLQSKGQLPVSATANCSEVQGGANSQAFIWCILKSCDTSGERRSTCTRVTLYCWNV